MDALQRQLIRDHRDIEKVLSTIRQSGNKLFDTGCRKEIIKIIDCLDFMANFPEGIHHPLEEKIIALLFDSSGINLRTGLYRIQKDHGMLELDTQALHQQAKDLINNNQDDYTAFHERLQSYCQRQQEHLNIENRLLIPAVAQWLSDKQCLEVRLSSEQQGLTISDRNHYHEMFRSIFNQG